MFDVYFLFGVFLPVFKDFDSFIESDTGWTIRDVCVLLIFTAKKHGISNATLAHVLRIISIMADCRRATFDASKCPKTVPALLRLIKVTPASHYRTIPLCSKFTFKKRKHSRDEDDAADGDICGYTLREEIVNGKMLYHCNSCHSVWDEKTVNRDGNHFTTVDLHPLLTDVMKRLGPTVVPVQFAQDGYKDLFDGERFRDMNCSPDDILISVHGDGAVLSKSSKKKAYLMFVRPLNLLPSIRQGFWLLHSLWIGEHLPKDRECFLLELSKQLGRLRDDRPHYSPLVWPDSNGNQRESQVLVHSFVGYLVSQLV